MEPRAKVLVVDDYEPNARGMRDLLVAAGHTVRVASNGADALESTEAIMTLLGQIVEARDPYTEGHCERLADYATALGAALGLPAFELETLNRGAALHDVGKIAIPDGVLLKAGRLDAGELALMRQHPVIGDNLCRTVRSLERVRPIVRSHHEREDGRGYPDGLSSGKIPLLAQIVGVVDVFDALTTDRPYRKALTVQASYDIMLADASSGWCPVALVETFIELHRRRPYAGSFHVFRSMSRPASMAASRLSD